MVQRKRVLCLAFVMIAWAGAAGAQESGIILERYARTHGLHYRWEPVVNNAVVSGPGGVMTFHAGSEFCLDRGQLRRLNQRVSWIGDTVWAPAAALDSLDRLATNLPAQWISVDGRDAKPALHAQRSPFRVVIDAGHGGRDHGATSPGGVREKDITLAVSRKLCRELESRGIEAMMTRQDDRYLSLSERVAVSNGKEPALFVSVHANASPSKKLRGFETYYLSEAVDDLALAMLRGSDARRFLGAEVVEETPGSVRAVIWDLRQAENRRRSMHAAQSLRKKVGGGVDVAATRVRDAGFYVLKWNEVPAVLVELGYLTNGMDERRLRSAVYQEKLARALADGIADFERQTRSGALSGMVGASQG